MTDKPGSKGNNADQDEVTAAPAATERLELEYPQIPLHLSLESLLVHSSSSSGSSSYHAMSAYEPNPLTLGDSWASLTDFESSNEEDLRSEHTDVGSLLDVHSSDDVHSINDEADGEQLTNEEEVTFEKSLHVQHPAGASVQQFTNQGHLVTGGSGAEYIGTESQETIRHSTVCRTTIVRPLTEPENRELRQSRTSEVPTKYNSITRITLLEEGLNADSLDYFKVLLLGPDVEQFKPEIQRKLGDALVSHGASSASGSPTSVSRFHLVPSSFGPGSEPEFADLVAIDKQIDFECYDTAETGRGPHSPASLVMRSSQTPSTLTSRWDGSKFIVTDPRWILPDLAIICVHLDEANNITGEGLAMVEFAERHGIPTILIRMDRGWQGNYGNTMEKTEYLCESFEPDREMVSGPVVAPNLPLDIPAFLSLDSSLLNKHIAFLIASIAASRSFQDACFVHNLDTPHKDQANFLTPVPPTRRSYLKNVLLTLWIVGVYFFLGAQLWPLASKSLSSKSVSATTSVGMPNSSVETSIGKVHDPTQTRLPDQTTPAFSDGGEKLHPGSQLTTIPSASPLASLGKDDMHFQVGMIGGSQLFVKLPKTALGCKKRSELQVVLTRANRTIPAVVQELFDGVFTVQLQPRDTYGEIEINLVMSKPPLSENLTVLLEKYSKNDYKPLEIALRAMNGTLRDAVDFVWANLPHWQSDMTLQDLTRDAERLKEDLKEALGGLRISHPMTMRSLLTAMSTLQMQASTRADRAYADVTRLTGQGFSRGRGMLKHVTDEISDPRAALLRMFKSVVPVELSPELQPGLLTKKLGAAQASARHILSSAAGKLRSGSAGGRHNRD